jgi:mitogen-activated protein kinase kinase kinase
MEYCEGGSLANLLEHGRIADETVIQVYAWEMLQGLAYLHEKGVVHRDVKPESMFVGITLTQIYFSMELVISNSLILVRQKCLRDRARPKLVSQWPGPILTV